MCWRCAATQCHARLYDEGNIDAELRYRITITFGFFFFSNCGQFMRAYDKRQPQFAFSFHGELSHDSINLVGIADDDITDWLKSLRSNGLLERTILIVMSDHGNRFAEVRNTLQGKLEERLPFFSFSFPDAFKNKYADAYAQFKRNVDRLTTPFDIHETLIELIGEYLLAVTDKILTRF